MRHVLLTGGAGFIGSHTCVEVMAAGWTPVIFDNLANSSATVLDRIETIAGRSATFVNADIRDREALDRVFRKHEIDAVLHFAGLKSVAESVADPRSYYDNNIGGTLTLAEVMQQHGVTRIVFSSSATVYEPTEPMPLVEDARLGPINPYGRSKWMTEQILRDIAAADRRWQVFLLRYFNPVGAHESGLIGEDPTGTPNNLMPFVAQVAVGRLPRLAIYGGDYPTIDGTGVRDYIHVVDLAQGHVAALEKLCADATDQVSAPEQVSAINLGTGRPQSVLQVVKSFEAASGRCIPYDIVDRRPGDVATSYADPARAHRVLGWKAERGLDAMCADAWRWQSANPKGFGG